MDLMQGQTIDSKSITDGLFQQVDNYMDGIMESYDSLQDGISSYMCDMFEESKNILSSAYDTIESTFDSMLNIGSSLSSIETSGMICVEISSFFEPFTGTLAEIVDSISVLGNQIYDSVIGSTSALCGMTEDFLSSAYKELGDQYDKLSSLITETWGKLDISCFTNLLSVINLKEIACKALKKLQDVAKNLMQIIIKLKNMITTLMKTITGWFDTSEDQDQSEILNAIDTLVSPVKRAFSALGISIPGIGMFSQMMEQLSSMILTDSIDKQTQAIKMDSIA